METNDDENIFMGVHCDFLARACRVISADRLRESHFRDGR